MRTKFTVVLLIMCLTVTAYAGIEALDVQQRLISVIKNCNSVASGAAIRIGNLSQQGTNLVTNNPSDFDEGDKTKLAAYKLLLTDLKNAADAVVAYDWGNIE